VTWKLPVFSMAMSQPVLQDHFYDPTAFGSLPPPGFQRAFGGDYEGGGQGTDRGFWWFEKVTDNAVPWPMDGQWGGGSGDPGATAGPAEKQPNAMGRTEGQFVEVHPIDSQTHASMDGKYLVEIINNTMPPPLLTIIFSRLSPHGMVGMPFQI